MCGITGAFAFSSKGRASFANIDAANNTLAKRGPDGGYTYITDNVALGHRRLSIIDVSCAGDQPMHSADGRFTIVFNGEIFNFKELQQQYLSYEEQSGLQSHSDTEIFLLLYKKFGTESFTLLRGFFAAAIYDHEQEMLVLVRDRLGKKPLLYYQDEAQLLFASEMKALFQLGIPRKLNTNILPLYFQFNFLPQPFSLIKNVQKLEPGHYMTVTKGGIHKKNFYSLSLDTKKYSQYTYVEAKQKLVGLLDEAVQLRMISDVPLGAFLSGGIDSSVVVALAAGHTNKLKTFSIGYKDNKFFDETYYANLVAEKFKTDHTVFSLSNADFLEHVYDVLDYLDEPFADSSAIPQYILSYHARKHVTVALSGDGGDEIFAGYNKHAAEWRVRQGGMVNTLISLGQPLWQRLPQSRNSFLGNKVRQLNRFAIGANLSPAERYRRWASLKSDAQVNNLLAGPHSLKNYTTPALMHAAIGGHDFNEVLLADTQLVLAGDMLVKVDLMSMANSLEVRSPFLDQKVVEFAFQLPSQYKIDGKMKKKIVQDAFRDVLPKELYNRPKRGFEIPLLGWLRKDLWHLIDNELLQDDFVAEQGLFDVVYIKNLKAKLQSSNPGDSHAFIWALLVFQFWWRKYQINS